jgi:HK97 family phage portal protein
MDIFGTLLGGGSLLAGVPGPLDDYWYQPVGTVTASGQRVDDQGAQMLSAWYRGRLILASVLAMLPLHVYRRLPNDGGAEVVSDHPLYDVLHDQPNDSQDSFQWRLESMFDLIDHGWAYSWIVPGARGFAHQLCRIDPKLVTPKRLYVRMPNGARVASRWVFDVRDPVTNEKHTFTQDEIFYLRGAGGKGILEYARSSLGTALSTESYAANIYGKGTLNGGVIENAGTLNPEAARRMAVSFATKVGEWHLPKILEQGSTFKPNDMTPEDAQMLLSRKYSVDDIARWLGVPRMMLENSDPSFGNGEQFTQNFLDINMGGWLALWEFGINGQLILKRATYFAQFKRQAFVRANFKDRVEGHVALVNAGIETVDEARDVEEMPKRGGKADELREPQNITGKPTAPSSSPADPAPSPQPKPADPAAAPSRKKRGVRADAIVTESAARLLRKEIAMVQKLAVRHAADVDAFAGAVTAFYVEHAGLVEQTLQMSATDAAGYCSQQAAQILGGDWLAALETWKTDNYAIGLAAIALEEEAA